MMSPRFAAAVGAVIMVTAFTTDARAGWTSGFGAPGPNGRTTSGVVYQGDLVIAGSFESIGDLYTRGAARWDGHAWTAMSAGRPLTDLLVDGGRLYATAYGQVLQWVETEWVAVPGSFNQQIAGIAIHDGDVYVVGGFDRLDFSPIAHMAKHDEIGWHNVLTPADSFYGHLDTVVEWNGQLVVAGSFTLAGGIHDLALYDASGWHVVPGVTADRVTCLAVSGQRLLVGGTLTVCESCELTSLASFDGASWTAYGPELAYEPRAITPLGDSLLTLSSLGVALWSGDSWSTVNIPSGSYASYTDAAAYAGQFVLLGWFRSSAFANLALLTEKGWRPLATGWAPDDIVFSLCATGGRLLVSGQFDHIGDIDAPYVAAWDGLHWETMGEPPGPILDFASSGDRIAAVGSLRSYAFGPSCATTWVDNRWQIVGHADDGEMYAAAWWRGALYVGGTFTSVDGVPARGLASWDGVQWSASSCPLDTVYDLFVSGDELLAAGDPEPFVGGATGVAVARFDGFAWLPMGGGFDGEVRCLTEHAGQIVAGGAFHTADGEAVRVVGVWDGTRWTDVGTGADDYGMVQTMASYNGTLVVGGTFRFQSNIYTLARLRGQQWSSMEGVGYETLALAPFGGSLMVSAGSDFGWLLRWIDEDRPSEDGVRFSVTAVSPVVAHTNVTIAYYAPVDEPTTVAIVDARGRRRATLNGLTARTGQHTLSWNLQDDAGRAVESGTYFACVIGDVRRWAAKRFVVLR